MLWLTLALIGLDAADPSPAVVPAVAKAVNAPKKTEGAAASTAAHYIPPSPRATIAYAVSLTSCGTGTNRHDNIKNGGHSSDPSFHEGAAVLKHSIHLSSIRNYHQSKSLFDYEMIAFVHPNAKSCSAVFSDLGYTVQIRETPFRVEDIKKTFLREHIVKSGCCGEKEYLKLYAYTLSDYPIVVHLDLDSLVLRPMDELFHSMLGDNGDKNAKDQTKDARTKVPVMHDGELPETIDAYFTRDYNMVQPGHKHPGVQGGFIIIKPSMDAFTEYVEIVKEGRFFQGSGWEGKGYGGYFGAQQIQGICSFYYDYRHPGTAVELNKCFYNAMADSPRQEKNGKCRDGREECQDCRVVPIESIKSVHFTLCAKPWKCPSWGGLSAQTKSICAEFHKEWFRIREDLDKTKALEFGDEFKRPEGIHRPDVYRGYCKSNGERGYIPTTQFWNTK